MNDRSNTMSKEKSLFAYEFSLLELKKTLKGCKEYLNVSLGSGTFDCLLYQPIPGLAFILVVGSEEVAKVEEKPDEPPFTAVPSHLQLDSHPSSPAGDTRCSTPTLSLAGGPVAVNPAARELALELLKVRNRLKLSFCHPIP